LAGANPDAVTCAITGDLADTGEPEVYFRLGELLGDLPLTVDLLIGNRDNRSALLGAFSGSGRFDNQTPMGRSL
jgi:hypothetical protein